MEAGLQPTDDQSCSGMVTSVASRAVGVRGGGAEGHALQSGSSSQLSSRPEPPHGGFLLQQTFDLPPFSLDGSTTLKRYFERFEEYCSRTYAGKLDDALPLLQSLLVGEVTEIFAACGGTDVTYEKLKQRMLRWVSLQDSSMQQSSRIRFDNIKRRPGEDPSLFALRLSSLFEDAYPTENMQTSELLRDRLIQNLPENIGEKLRLDIKYNKAIHGKTLQWDHYLTILQCKKDDGGPSSSVVLSAESKSQSGSRQGKSRPVTDQSRTRNTRAGTVDHQSEGSRSKSRNRSQRRGSTRDMSRPSSSRRSSSRPRVVCDHCGKRGHIMDDCRRKYELCYGCGSSSHFIKDCPLRSSRREPAHLVERSDDRSQRPTSRSSKRTDLELRQRSPSGNSSRSSSPAEHAPRSRRGGPEHSENW